MCTCNMRYILYYHLFREGNNTGSTMIRKVDKHIVIRTTTRWEGAGVDDGVWEMGREGVREGEGEGESGRERQRVRYMYMCKHT